jgi:hypothetical protein
MQVRHCESIAGYDEAGALFTPSRPLSFEERDRGRSLFDQPRDIDLSANNRNRGQADTRERKNEPKCVAHLLSSPSETDACSPVKRAQVTVGLQPDAPSGVHAIASKVIDAGGDFSPWVPTPG